MKPEPLKGKLERNYLGSPQKYDFITREDLVSAVAWLKEQLELIKIEGQSCYWVNLDGVNIQIDKAFADVVKTTANKEAKE